MPQVYAYTTGKMDNGDRYERLQVKQIRLYFDRGLVDAAKGRARPSFKYRACQGVICSSGREAKFEAFWSSF